MVLLVAATWACEPEQCLARAAQARADLRLSEAADLLEIACDAGDAEGCARLAYARFFGSGAPKDEDGALEQLQESCEAGSTYGCAVQRFLDAEQDQEEIELWYRESCEAGEPFSCYALGWSVMARDAGLGGSWLLQGCEAGVGAACTTLGRLYHSGQGLPEDEDKALALYQQGCESGSITGCLLVETEGPEYREERVETLCTGGMEEACYELGRRAAVVEDWELSARWYGAACELEDPQGCGQLGMLLAEGRVEGDPSRGEALLRDACEAEAGVACGSLAWLMIDGRLAGSFEEAVVFATRGCVLGDAWACFFSSGLLLEMDRQAALVAMDQACELGLDEACFAVARESPGPVRVQVACDRGDSESCNVIGLAMLADGDTAGAFEHFGRYCDELGDLEACFNQALILMDDRDKPFDATIGATRMGALCAEEHGKACAMLGAAWLEGTAFGVDPDQAFLNFQRSCDLGAPKGCRLLGMAYEHGVGVKRSRRKARKAYREACALGDEESC